MTLRAAVTSAPLSATAAPKRSLAAPHAPAAAGMPRYLQSFAAGGGRALPAALRAHFETGLQVDFSGVRLHTGGAAAEAARAVEARAFTLGRDIVFGAGEHAPASAPGRRLLAHELVHVTQQARSGEALQRDELPGAVPAPASGLAAESDATRESLRFDTDEALGDYRADFALVGEPVTADNVVDSFEWTTPGIDAGKDDKKRKILRDGLRNYARGVFDLWPHSEGANKGKSTSTLFNPVHVQNLDLTSWSGPNTAFRFTCIGGSKKGQITVRILIEELPQAQQPLADATAVPGIETSKATPYGLTHEALFPTSLWERVLRALDKIDASMLMRIRDVGFEASADEVGASGEAAEFEDRFATATGWKRRIVIYRKMVKADDPTFAFTLAHEIGHAVDSAPTQGAKGRLKAFAHVDAGFKAAAKKDGGIKKAVTRYGGSSESEYFAESFAMFVQQPQTLQLLRPNLYAWFVTYNAGALTDPALNPALAPAAGGSGP